MTGLDVEDGQSGFRVISADLLRRLRLSSKGYMIETEILLKAAPRVPGSRTFPSARSTAALALPALPRHVDHFLGRRLLQSLRGRLSRGDRRQVTGDSSPALCVARAHQGRIGTRVASLQCRQMPEHSDADDHASSRRRDALRACSRSTSKTGFTSAATTTYSDPRRWRGFASARRDRRCAWCSTPWTPGGTAPPSSFWAGWRAAHAGSRSRRPSSAATRSGFTATSTGGRTRSATTEFRDDLLRARDRIEAAAGNAPARAPRRGVVDPPARGSRSRRSRPGGLRVRRVDDPDAAARRPGQRARARTGSRFADASIVELPPSDRPRSSAGTSRSAAAGPSGCSRPGAHRARRGGVPPPRVARRLHVPSVGVRRAASADGGTRPPDPARPFLPSRADSRPIRAVARPGGPCVAAGDALRDLAA